MRLGVRNFIAMTFVTAGSLACVKGGGRVPVTSEEGVTVITQAPTRVGERTSPTPTPVPPDPNASTPNTPSNPTSSGSGQSIDNVSIYCSSDLIGWSDASMADVSVLKFTFFEKNRMNFYERTEWNKFTDATELKNSLKQKKAVLPTFTNIPDGVWEVLICKETDINCAFFAIFGPFTLYHYVMLGEASGVVGAMEVTLAAGKVTSSAYAEFLYPTNPQGVTCDY